MAVACFALFALGFLFAGTCWAIDSATVFTFIPGLILPSTLEQEVSCCTETAYGTSTQFWEQQDDESFTSDSLSDDEELSEDEKAAGLLLTMTNEYARVFIF